MVEELKGFSLTNETYYTGFTITDILQLQGNIIVVFIAYQPYLGVIDRNQKQEIKRIE